ncbi:hypothetical protein ACQR16_17200 [Bradyrhizobium oligotrophicum]|uniref:hypothetical protein n=1 Tax=Bradyrhizobium oligotrophicum TaxID=44255 RepID=UPI003EBA79B7
MSGAPDFAALVAQAEKAVAGVKDPELKRIAFQKVLDELLAGGGSSTPSSRRTQAPRTGHRPTSKGAKAATGPKAYILEMVEDAFFKKQKTMGEVKDELENRGHHIPRTSLSGPLQALCKEKVLRRQKTGGSGSKKTFAYSNY